MIHVDFFYAVGEPLPMRLMIIAQLIDDIESAQSNWVKATVQN